MVENTERPQTSDDLRLFPARISVILDRLSVTPRRGIPESARTRRLFNHGNGIAFAVLVLYHVLGDVALRAVLGEPDRYGNRLPEHAQRDVGLGFHGLSVSSGSDVRVSTNVDTGYRGTCFVAPNATSTRATSAAASAGRPEPRSAAVRILRARLHRLAFLTGFAGGAQDTQGSQQLPSLRRIRPFRRCCWRAGFPGTPHSRR
jgi:hypothetical protein